MFSCFRLFRVKIECLLTNGFLVALVGSMMLINCLERVK